MLVRTSYGKQLNYISYLIVIYIYIFRNQQQDTALNYDSKSLNHGCVISTGWCPPVISWFITPIN